MHLITKRLNDERHIETGEYMNQLLGEKIACVLVEIDLNTELMNTQTDCELSITQKQQNECGKNSIFVSLGDH